MKKKEAINGEKSLVVGGSVDEFMIYYQGNRWCSTQEGGMNLRGGRSGGYDDLYSENHEADKK